MVVHEWELAAFNCQLSEQGYAELPVRHNYSVTQHALAKLWTRVHPYWKMWYRAELRPAVRRFGVFYSSRSSFLSRVPKIYSDSATLITCCIPCCKMSLRQQWVLLQMQSSTPPSYSSTNGTRARPTSTLTGFKYESLKYQQTVVTFFVSKQCGQLFDTTL